MAATSTTPQLATMPTEIVCMIGDNFSVNEIKDWTLVSKRFREILLPKLCKHLRFAGNMKELTNSLNAYFARKIASFRHLAHHHTRFVTFEVTKFNDISEMYTWVHTSGVNSIPIGRFLADTPNLRGIIFDTWLRNPKEASKFNTFIRKGPDWQGPKHVYFKEAPEDQDMRKIVTKFKAGALKGISAPPGLFPSHYDELVRNGANLTSLRLDKYFCISSGVSGRTDFGIRLVNSISTDFPQLESLNISEKQSSNALLPYDYYHDLRLWSREIARVASILDKLPRLRRLAFSMREIGSNDKAIHSITKELLAMIEEEVPVPFEVVGLEGICKLVTTYFAAHAKGLEEVCIATGHPTFYRATLTNGDWNISEESFEDLSQKYLFPNVLEN